MKTYYKVKGYQTIFMRNKKGSFDKFELVENELLTGSEVLKYGYSIQTLPNWLEEVKVKKIYWFFGCRFDAE